MPKCEQCGRELNTDEGLAQHMRDKHGIGRVTSHDMKEARREEREKIREADVKKHTSKKRTKALIAAVITLLVILGIAYFFISYKPPASGGISLNLPSYLPFQGSAAAGNDIIEFGDLQCPFCAQFHVQNGNQLLADYVNTSKAKFYFVGMAFIGADSTTLGQGAWCANDQGKYYDFVDYAYLHQGTENSGWGSAANVKKMAVNIGLNSTQFSTCIDSQKYASRVSDSNQLAQGAGVSSTPSFLVGNSTKGYTLVTGASYSAVKQAIDKVVQ